MKKLCKSYLRLSYEGMNRSLIGELLGERDRKSCNYAAVDRFTDRRTFERNSM